MTEPAYTCPDCFGTNGGHYYHCSRFDKPGYVQALEAGNEKLRLRIAELEAQLATVVPVPAGDAVSVQRDAERYRWMTTNMVDVSNWPDEAFKTREDLGRWIDAAMLESRSK
jgi:hypothetical protein